MCKSLNIKSYLRIASNNLTEEQEKITLDYASKEAIDILLNMSHNDYYTYKSEISKFFK